MGNVKGRVKWFNDNKGYGWIAIEGNECPGVFVHYTAIEGEGFKTLVEDEVVEFELIEGPKGAQASRVIRGGAQ